MNFFNRTGKKLQALTEANAQRKAELDKLEERENSLKREKTVIEEDIQRSAEVIDKERRDQAKHEREKAHLIAEAFSSREKLATLRENIAQAKDLTERARARRAQLLEEVSGAEKLVQTEHLAAEDCADQARQRAMQLQKDHVAERDRWEAMRGQYEEMNRQIDASANDNNAARQKRDEMKRACMDVAAELRDLKARYQRLEADCLSTEDTVKEEEAVRSELDAELQRLDTEQGQKMVDYKELEETNNGHIFALKETKVELENQRHGLSDQLRHFEERYEKAKLLQEQIQLEHEKVRETLAELLPQYFKLQTDHTARRREMEYARRDHEILSWEHYKINRDLEMLCKSYDPSFQHGDGGGVVQTSNPAGNVAAVSTVP
jgi:chromosome segregation ATPase